MRNTQSAEATNLLDVNFKLTFAEGHRAVSTHMNYHNLSPSGSLTLARFLKIWSVFIPFAYHCTGSSYSTCMTISGSSLSNNLLPNPLLLNDYGMGDLGKATTTCMRGASPMRCGKYMMCSFPACRAVVALPHNHRVGEDLAS